MQSFGLKALWRMLALATIIGANGFAGAAPNDTVIRATQVLDLAAANHRKLSSFVLVAHQDTARGTVVTTTQVRNQKNGPRLVRIETALHLPKAKPRTTIHIMNGDGSWQLYENRAIRFGFPLGLERTIPVRLVTARNLRQEDGALSVEADDLIYTIESEADFFGMPCHKITITLSETLIARLSDPNDPWRKKITARAARDRKGPNPEQIAESRYPVSYVYYVEKSLPFIVSWQAFSYSGKKISEVSYQDFKANEVIPDNAFSIPKEYPVIEVGNPAEYNALLQRIR